MFVLDVRQQAKAIPGLLVTDSGGKIMFATSVVAGILGYEAGQLLGSNISKLMSPPFSHLHGGWMKVRPQPYASKILLPVLSEPVRLVARWHACHPCTCCTLRRPNACRCSAWAACCAILLCAQANH
jgi:hypothetical protein